jgi:glycosyltransferase involved in cell wall biosynthesis
MIKIPKIIHQIWIGPLPPPMRWIRTWKEMNPSWQHILWDNQKVFSRKWRCQRLIDEYLKKAKEVEEKNGFFTSLGARLTDKKAKYFAWHVIADILRYEILYEYGGYMPGADSECIKPIDKKFDDGCELYIVNTGHLYQEKRKELEKKYPLGNPTGKDKVLWDRYDPMNAAPVEASTKGNKFLEQIINELLQLKNEDLGEAVDTTGNVFMGKMLRKYNPPNVKVEYYQVNKLLPGYGLISGAWDEKEGFYSIHYGGTTHGIYERGVKEGLRILLTNDFLDQMATGTETWLQTMAVYLQQNHEVDIYVRNKLYDFQNYGLGNVGEYSPYKRYDLALINHQTCLNDLRDNQNIKVKVFTSHGPIHQLEQPIEGADYYVGVSEEIVENLKKSGYQNVVLIRNPINCEMFKASRPVNRALKNILFLSNYQGNWTIIKQACLELNLNYHSLSFRRNAWGEIDWADLVVALGRGCLEAMAMERNVIVYDYNGADGFVDEKSIYDFRQCNCSGRYNRINYDVGQLKEEFKKYNPDLGPKLREYILKNNSVDLIAQQYLNLIKKI